MTICCNSFARRKTAWATVLESTGRPSTQVDLTRLARTPLFITIDRALPVLETIKNTGIPKKSYFFWSVGIIFRLALWAKWLGSSTASISILYEHICDILGPSNTHVGVRRSVVITGNPVSYPLTVVTILVPSYSSTHNLAGLSLAIFDRTYMCSANRRGFWTER